MTFTLERQVTLFKPEGRMDLQGGNALSQKIAAVVPAPGQIWVIDLVKVDFMDSSGLVSLVKGLKTARQHNCHLVICNVTAAVRLVLELTHLDSVFDIFNTYEDVLNIIEDKSLVVAS
ncbi:anti-anti-sigma factor [Rivularia sp. PCC 7116]|uniref:STAS domain-containing protein n=1 Tax=Rivularia sp. PCC 7116 TaxID=373994 RepID=UPI00029F0105|nr:STAS domain-containing protein [Rivularia sp. PCC 7116]AFY56632.1 anti-anti-sigma factor [Rivularia sp. PCC 7116]